MKYAVTLGSAVVAAFAFAIATPAVATAQPSKCHSSYIPCLPIVSDVDCAGGSGDGPVYTGRVQVVGPDDYGLDRDGDGIGCE